VIEFLVRAQKTLLGTISGVEFITGGVGVADALQFAEYLADEPAYNRDFCDAAQRRVSA